MIRKKYSIPFFYLITLALLLSSFYFKQTSNPWKGKPQVIPGRIECELYDEGGAGISYRDNDSVNNGSGKLNPANGTFLNEFRMHEGVDISYTKSNGIDDNPYNIVMPNMEQLYVGWTEPSEWINYTVNVKHSGVYTVSVMYTAHDDGGISLSVDNHELEDVITLPSTFNSQDTVAWRQWHHWNLAKNVSEVTLTKGTHVLTLHTKIQGNMNYDYLEFSLKGKK